jgi:hypothetical protein
MAGSDGRPSDPIAEPGARPESLHRHPGRIVQTLGAGQLGAGQSTLTGALAARLREGLKVAPLELQERSIDAAPPDFPFRQGRSDLICQVVAHAEARRNPPGVKSPGNLSEVSFRSPPENSSTFRPPFDTEFPHLAVPHARSSYLISRQPKSNPARSPGRIANSGGCVTRAGRPEKTSQIPGRSWHVSTALLITSMGKRASIWNAK